jgi:hypothetical protein
MPDFNAALIPPSLKALPIWLLHHPGMLRASAVDFGRAHSAYLLQRGAVGMAIQPGEVAGTDTAIIVFRPSGSAPSDGWPCYVERADDGGLIAFARCTAADFRRLNGVVLSGVAPITGRRCADAAQEAPVLSPAELATLGILPTQGGGDLPGGSSGPLPPPFQARSGAAAGDIDAPAPDDDDDPAGSIALSSLADEAIWVAWRAEAREDGKPPTKLPYCAPGRKAETDDPSTWIPHDRAVRVAETIANDLGGGIGIILGQQGNLWLAGVDLDTCRDPTTGQIAPWAQTVLDRLDTYSEVSPSGLGVKAYLLIEPDDIAPLRTIMGTQHGRQFKRANGATAHPPAIELYISHRYFAVTWQAMDGLPDELRLVPLDDLRWLIEEIGPAFAGKSAGQGKGGGDNSRSGIAFKLAAKLRREGRSFEEMCAALRADPTTADWAREKGDAAGGRELKRLWDNVPEQEQEPWPEPVDILADQDPGAAPILTERHVPAALWPFVADSAERMGVATSTVALCAIVACAAAISEEWKLQPKRHDYTWTERACLWGATIGLPSIMKSPVIAITTAPIDSLEIAARERWNEEMAAYRLALAEWKAADKPDPEPMPPRCARYMVESTTVEALQEVLRDDKDGKFFAPLGKVLCKQDELAEFLAGMDRYSTGKGGSDRGAYLRLYNGGRYSIDRIGRGSFAAKSWSGCILGGCQPDPIQQIASNATDDGLLQRLMFDVPAPRGPGQDRAPNHAAIETYRSLFPALAALRPARNGEGDRVAHVVLHADAHASRESIDATARAMSLWPDASPQLQSAFGKWSGLFARLCLVFHLVEVAAARAQGERGPPTDTISPETAARVRCYMREILAPMLLRADSIMFASNQTAHAAWIASYIIANGRTRIAARDIVQSYRPLRAPEQRETLESTMDSLCTFGWLRPEPPRGGSVRPTAWRVNLDVHIRFAERAEAERSRREAVKADIAAHVAEIRGKR